MQIDIPDELWEEIKKYAKGGHDPYAGDVTYWMTAGKTELCQEIMNTYMEVSHG